MDEGRSDADLWKDVCDVIQVEAGQRYSEDPDYDAERQAADVEVALSWADHVMRSEVYKKKVAGVAANLAAKKVTADEILDCGKAVADEASSAWILSFGRLECLQEQVASGATQEYMCIVCGNVYVCAYVVLNSASQPVR